MTPTVDEAREALLEAVPSDWGRARVRAFEAAIRAEKSAERIALARVNGELGIALVDAEAKLAALREAVAGVLTEPFDPDPLRKAYEETIGTTGHLSLAATPAEESGHVHDPFLADRCGGCAALAKPASADVEAAREALLEAVPSDWGRARVRALIAAVRAEKSAERIALARVNGELGIALVDAEAKLAALRSALFDEYGINVVDEALLVAIASPSEMEVNRERWQAARDRLRAALAATPAEDDAKDAER